jgi:hypothetical protein
MTVRLRQFTDITQSFSSPLRNTNPARDHGAAFYRRAGLERAFRDVQGARFHPLQEKAQLRHAGRPALGLDIDGERVLGD